MHVTPLPDLVILLAAAVAIVSCFRAMGVSPVLGYLVAGAIIGPTGIGWIHDLDTTSAIAELGIVFLMFMIGLDLSWDRLKAMRFQVFGVGTAQLALTSFVLLLLGLAMGLDFTDALIISGALSLSSTALVLELLRSHRELATQTGRLSLAILILQDLAALPLLVLITVLGKGDGPLFGAMVNAGVNAFAALILIAIAGRLLLRPLFRLIARFDIHELFVATVLLVVLGIAWLTESAGLSMAMGAFLAGLFIAETEFQQQIELDVRPYKRLLMGLFFMTVGMRIDPAFIVEHMAEMLFWAAGLIGVKAGVLFVVLRGFKYTRRSSAHTALLLAQGGEFGFIMFGLAASLGVLEGEMVQKLLVVITLTMAATPLLDMMGAELEKRWWRTVKRRKPEAIAQETQDMSEHVIIAGYGRMGKLIATHLADERIPFLALDANPREISAGRKAHHPVYFGDAARPDVLDALGIARALVLVIALDNSLEADKLAGLIRDRYPELPIIARTGDLKQAQKLEKRGVIAVPELQVAGMRMLANLMNVLGRPEEEIHRVMEQVRSTAT